MKKKVVNIAPDMFCGRVGQKVILVSNEYVGPSSFRHKKGEVLWRMVDLDVCPNGIPGNYNPERRSFFGWRWTTDDWSCHAHGVWEITEFGRSRRWANEYLGERMIRVVLKEVRI